MATAGNDHGDAGLKGRKKMKHADKETTMRLETGTETVIYVRAVLYEPRTESNVQWKRT